MQVTHDEGEYRGQRYPLLFYGDGWGAVAHGGAPASEFPDALAFGSNSRGDWVKLPWERLTWWRVAVSAMWKGERVAIVGVERDGQVGIAFSGSPRRAEELGIPGDQHNGWMGTAPVIELGSIEVTERKVR